MVHGRDAAVGAVVEAAVDADGPVDAVDHPRVAAREPPQAVEVEIERVEQTGRRAGGDPVLLDGQAARAQLARERPQELRPTAGGGGDERVEQGPVGGTAACPGEVERRLRGRFQVAGEPAWTEAE